MQNDTSRPLINDLDTTALIKLQKTRNPLYQALANIIIPTDKLTPQQIVAQIQRQLKLA
ncbi:MAG: shikimate kinase [Bombilactobacillus sp.]